MLESVHRSPFLLLWGVVRSWGIPPPGLRRELKPLSLCDVNKRLPTERRGLSSGFYLGRTMMH